MLFVGTFNYLTAPFKQKKQATACSPLPKLNPIINLPNLILCAEFGEFITSSMADLCGLSPAHTQANASA